MLRLWRCFVKSKYKPYPSYRDSGIEWLGEVPIGWDVRRLKTILQERKEKNSPVKTKDILSLCMYRGVIPYSEKGNSGNKAKDDLTAYKLAYPNDIVLNSMNVVAGSVGLSKYFGAVSPVYYMLYPRKSTDDISYFNAIFQSESFQKSLIGLGNGILVKQSEKTGKLNTIRMKISMDSLNDVLMPIPPFQEQQTIANYLDNATAKIDTLIEKQTKLIALLKEKRQAVISTAVTRGLDNTVAMKDSGVEWLGEIPESWVLVSLGYISNIDCGSTPNRNQPSYWNGNIPWIKTGEVKYSNITETEECITEKGFANSSLRLAKKGTILMAMYGQGVTRGRVAILHIDATYNQACVAMTFSSKVFNEYAKYFFIAAYSYIRDFGNETSQMNLNAAIIEKIKFLVPAKDEQKAIVEYLDIKISKIDKLINKSTKAIDLLKEKRTTLISSAVTGKIDVRKAS